MGNKEIERNYLYNNNFKISFEKVYGLDDEQSIKEDYNLLSEFIVYYNSSDKALVFLLDEDTVKDVMYMLNNLINIKIIMKVELLNQDLESVYEQLYTIKFETLDFELNATDEENNLLTVTIKFKNI